MPCLSNCALQRAGSVKILAYYPTAPRPAIRCGYSSSSVTSRYRLEPHSLSATYLSRAVASMRADLPSGKAKITEEERKRRRQEALLRQREEIDKLAREIAAKAPPPTEEQKRELSRLLYGGAR